LSARDRGRNRLLGKGNMGKFLLGHGLNPVSVILARLREPPKKPPTTSIKQL
jgi:hypothetical protein